MRVTRQRVQPADQQTVLRDGPLPFGGHQLVGGLHHDIGDAVRPVIGADLSRIRRNGLGLRHHVQAPAEP